MKLAVLADRVSFEMMDGRRVFASNVHDGMMYDPDGTYWPRCSMLVGPFTPGRVAITKRDRVMNEWFGKSYDLCRGGVRLPPRGLGAWTQLGAARRVFYTRRGVDGHKPPGPKKHRFNESGMWDLFERRKPLVLLYTRGAFLRFEMPAWCTVDGRGIARP